MMGKAAVKEPTLPPPSTRHEDDLYTWVQEQIALLRAGRLSEVDARNVAEELTDVGNEPRDKLERAIAVLTQHLLKWDHQPRRRSRSWEQSIAEQRRRIHRFLKRNPGLESLIGESIEVGYADGRGRVLAETKLAKSTLAETCPYSFDDMMRREVEFDSHSKPSR